MIFSLIIGLFAGVLSGLFGIGGGVVIVPALLYIQKFQPTMATGTSLAALLLPVGALGAWQYYKAGQVHIIDALLIAFGLLLGAGVGARIALSLPQATLRKAFSIFLAFVAVRLWFK